MAHACFEQSGTKEGSTPQLTETLFPDPLLQEEGTTTRSQMDNSLKKCSTGNGELRLSNSENAFPPQSETQTSDSVGMRSGVREDPKEHTSTSGGESLATVLIAEESELKHCPPSKVKFVKRQNGFLCLTVLCIAVIIGVGGGISTGVVGYYFSLKDARGILTSKNVFVLNSSVNAFHDTWKSVVNDALGVKNFLEAMGTNFSDPATMRDAYNFTFFLLAAQSVQTSTYVNHLSLQVPFCKDFDKYTACNKSMFLSFECVSREGPESDCFYSTNDDSGEKIFMKQVVINKAEGYIQSLSYVATRPMIELKLHKGVITGQTGFFHSPSVCTVVDENPYYYIAYHEQNKRRGRYVDYSAGSYLKNWYRVFDHGLQKAPKSFTILYDLAGTVVVYSRGTEIKYSLPCCSTGDAKLTKKAPQCGAPTEVVIQETVNLLVERIKECNTTSIISDKRFAFVLESQGFVIATQRWFHVESAQYSEETLFFVAYGTPVVTGLEGEKAISVVLCVLIVVLSIFSLGGISLLSINQLQKTLELVSILALHVSTYDLDSMEAILNSTPNGFRFLAGINGDNFLRQEFSHILENLRAYRPFLPQALLTRLRPHSENSSAVVESSLSEDDHSPRGNLSNSCANSIVHESENPFYIQKARVVAFNDPSRRLKRVKGTILVAELYGCPKDQLDSITLIDTFLDIVLTHARNSGGVTERIEARQVLISYNFHTPLLRHQHRACKCALAIQENLIKANIIAFIAITAGPNVVGTIGTSEQKAHVVSGFNVELAFHLVKLQTLLGSRIIVTHQVAHESSVATIPVDKIEVFSQRDNAMVERVILEVVAHDTSGMTVEHMFAKMVFSYILFGRVDDAVAALRHYMERYSVMEDVPWFARRLLELCLNNCKMIDGGYKRKGLFWEFLEGRELLRGYFMEEIRGENHFFFGSYNPFLGRVGDGDSLDESYASLVDSPVDDVQCAKRKIGEHSLVRERALRKRTQSEGALFSLYLKDGGEMSDSEERRGKGVVVAQDAMEGQSDFASQKIVDIKGQVYYVTGQLLGKGRFGEVYLGMSDSGNFMATKILPVEENASALVSEVEALVKLRHENIVTYDTCAIKSDRFYIFTEYMAAGSMLSLINRVGPLPEKAACKYGRDILFGLQFLHHEKYVHCDLKPDNVFLSAEGICKLGDFGTVQLTRSVAECAFVIRGTPRFMAPEAAIGSYTYKADIYSFGITLAFMLIGRDPWHVYVDSDEQFLVRLTGDGAKMKPLLPTNLNNKQLENAIRMCCEFEPEKRPPVDDLLTMLS